MLNVWLGSQESDTKRNRYLHRDLNRTAATRYCRDLPLAFSDIDHGKVSIRRHRAPAKTIDDGRVGARPIHSYVQRRDTGQYESSAYGNRGPSLAAVWYQSAKVITVLSEHRVIQRRAEVRVESTYRRQHRRDLLEDR